MKAVKPKQNAPRAAHSQLLASLTQPETNGVAACAKDSNRHQLDRISSTLPLSTSMM